MTTPNTTTSAKIIGSTHQSNMNLPIGVSASLQAHGKEAMPPMPPNHLAAAERAWKIAKGGYTSTMLDSLLGENTMEGLFNEAKKVAALEAKLEACEAQNKKMRDALEECAARCKKSCKGCDIYSGEPLCAGCPAKNALSSPTS